MENQSIRDKVISHLKEIKIGQTPTQIGLAIGKDYNSASSSVTNPLKKLVEEKLVSKIKTDGKVLYSWIN